MTDDTVYATLNDLPKELLDDVIDSIPHANLKQCSLVGKRWVHRCQERLFERFTLSAQMTERWTKPVGENQPLLFSYVKRLTLVGVYPPDWMDVNFARHMSCFGGGDSSGLDEEKPCRVQTLQLVSSSVDVDGEVISRVLGALRFSVRTVIMSSVSIPPVKDVRPFFCTFSDLKNVHIPGPQFSSVVPNGEPRYPKEFTLPPLDGELQLLFLYHGVEGVVTSLSELPLRFRSVTVSPPGGQCNLEIDNILAACGETVKMFHVKRTKLDVQVLRPITLSPCTELEEIRLSLRDARDPGPGTIHLFDSVTSPHLSQIVLHFVVPLSSRKIDSSLYTEDWTTIDESLYRLAERLRIMHESQAWVWGAPSNWAVPRQKEEVKRLQVVIEARFLFAPLGSEKVEFGEFLSKFREVGDVTFVPQKIRASIEDECNGWAASHGFGGI